MVRDHFLVALLLLQMIPVYGLVGYSAPFLRPIIWLRDKSEHRCRNDRHLNIAYDQRWNREIEENSRKKAQGGGISETVAGAVLGSLILGPFGKYFR